ncbi:MAG: SWIM zinc finger family protein [Clostridia bacterium]|nr:SWIM zinc finger family protein [Clostridia bacterium]
MEELKKALKMADDEYLVSLSNKGTLKRSYKDLEAATITASYMDGSAYVTVGKDKCVIVSPLAQSQCTCPSRSICRHIITSIIWLKQNLLEDMPEDKSEEDSESSTEQNETAEDTAKELKDSLSLFSLKELQRAMKKRYFGNFAEKAGLGILPEMEEASVITVQLPQDGVTVKLLHPIEYSACTCHSRELCKHKAAAILAWQIRHGIVKPEQLSGEVISSDTLDISDIHSKAENTAAFLGRILSDGLVRSSEDVVEQTEIQAVMCHNARLAQPERLMRELGNRLKAYAAHSPEFSIGTILSLIMDNMILLQKIIRTNDEKRLAELLGEFKNTYSLTDTLELIPLARRHFSSASGYEGEVYYYLNKDINSSEPFLTFSDVRPTFYQTNRKFRSEALPWNLNTPLKEIAGCELRLKMPKIAGGKLSSSKETRAEVLEKANLNQSAVQERIYTDYSKAVHDIFVKKSAEESETDRLVLIAVSRCIRSESDEISQTHTITVEDCFSQRLTLRARYKEENKDYFESLVKMGKTMLENDVNYVVFGSTYIEGGRLYVYPIAAYDTIKLPQKESGKLPAYASEKNIGYIYFSELFYDIRNMLSDMIQCGINSFDFYEQIRDLSDEAQKMGLTALSGKLYQLFEKLTAKNHDINADNKEIIILLSEIYRYIIVGIGKTEVNIAIQNLNTKETEQT